MRESDRVPGTPRWVKVSAVVAGILLVAAISAAILSGGKHSPWRHLLMSSGIAGALTADIGAAGTAPFAGRAGSDRILRS